jgi:hypothetical protein
VPTPLIEEQFFGLRDRHSDDDFAAVGIEPGSEADTIRRTFKLDPATAAILDKAMGNPPSEQELITAYLPGATSVFDAADRRNAHVAEAKAHLSAAGWDIDCERLPRAAIDLFVRSLDIQKRAAEDRQRFGR